MKPWLRRLISYTTRALVAVALIVIGVGVAIVLHRTAPEPQRRAADDMLPRVVVFEAQAVPVHRQWRGFGTAQAYHRAQVPAQVTATVRQRPENVREGKWIRKDVLLLELDDSEFQRELEVIKKRITELDAQLQAIEVDRKGLTERLEYEREEVRIARDDLNRVQSLFERGSTSQQEVNNARRMVLTAERARSATEQALESLEPREANLQASREVLEAQAAVVSLNIERCKIVSPLAGYLQSVDVRVGEQVMPGQPVAHVLSLDRIEVPVQFPASARVDLVLGDEVLLESLARAGERWTARIARLSPDNQPQTRTFLAYIELLQSEAVGNGSDQPARGLLMPGHFVAATATSHEQKVRFVVPRRAVQADRIQFVESGVIRSHPVRIAFVLEAPMPQLGVPDDQWAVLEDDLPQGMLVLRSYAPMLRDGDRVDIARHRNGEAPGQHARRDAAATDEVMP